MGGPPPIKTKTKSSPANSVATAMTATTLTPLAGAPERTNSGTTNNTEEHHHHEMARHLTLFDLVCIGVGSTVGSGIFVLSGLIAKDMSGPASAISWAISGAAALTSGACYAELAGRIPEDGSSFAYVHQTMGELPAIIAAVCLTFEYTVAAALVARSWGDKFVDYLQVEMKVGSWIQGILYPGLSFSPMAFFISVAAIALLLKGVRESKTVTNVFTTIKIAVVTLMVLGGLALMNSDNLEPFVPPAYGVSGVMRGATTSFFGYLGFDEVCCVSGEAINPEKNMPRAVMIVLTFITTLYIVAAVALTGMQPYEEISETSGFSSAFLANNWNVASQICALGEVVCLPIVALVTVMAQPRLQFALTEHGLFPKAFGEVDDTGNLSNGIWLSGVFMTLIASFIPLTYLDDTVSSAVLVAYTMTNSSLILCRYHSPTDKPYLLENLLLRVNVSSYAASLLWVHSYDTFIGRLVAVIATALAIVSCVQIYRKCPKSHVFGRGSSAVVDPRKEHESHVDEYFFRTPFLPFLPCMGMFINWYLVAQLQVEGVVTLVGFFGVAAACYLAAHGSSNAFRNGRHTYQMLPNNMDGSNLSRLRSQFDEEESMGNEHHLVRHISLPRVAASI